MANFGHFPSGGSVPIQEFEGDYMLQDREYVKIFRRSQTPSVDDLQVAAIHLDKGQSVKELSDSPAESFQARVR
jgi:hypothetical protein